ncbi:hypothetical protein KGQ90_16330 [Modicisalibacter tunisiensis]|uniref:hypothetical protein n=1 Tax=Modicisalibacter tunisiensis TaxID=390637 RepID=UPI001CCD20C5|nr:hypothetical protein [Modicisalibacter tunisiensis]MBZ9540487.1 hypothetical protein [Modicisalibacter tunisiensis]
MPETMPAEVVPFTPGRAALTRASHYAEALAALVEAKATEHEDPDAGPVFVDAVRAFDLNPAAAPCPVTEGRWELALAGLVAEDVGALEVEVMPWPLDEGGEVFRLSARLRGDLAPDQLARLGLWERQARELALVRLGDGLTHCEALAAALDPDAGPDEVTARGGELLRCVRELLALMDKAPRTPRRRPARPWRSVSADFSADYTDARGRPRTGRRRRARPGPLRGRLPGPAGPGGAPAGVLHAVRARRCPYLTPRETPCCRK